MGKSQTKGECSHLFYNKFEVSRFKSSHRISDEDYYESVNKIILE